MVFAEGVCSPKTGISLEHIHTELEEFTGRVLVPVHSSAHQEKLTSGTRGAVPPPERTRLGERLGGVSQLSCRHSGSQPNSEQLLEKPN